MVDLLQLEFGYSELLYEGDDACLTVDQESDVDLFFREAPAHGHDDAAWGARMRDVLKQFYPL